MATDPGFGARLASREEDALIDEKLFGFEVVWVINGGYEVPYRKGQRDFGMPATVPLYHERMSDAWRIVEEFRRKGVRLYLTAYEDLVPEKRYCQNVLDHKDERYKVSGWDTQRQVQDEAAYGKTGQEAIVNKALEILGRDARKG